MTKIRRVYILLAGLVLLAFCGICAYRFILPIPTPQTPTPPPPNWFTDWLTDPACQPPCWEGITPGVSTITETVKILQGLPGVGIVFGPGRPLNRGHIQLEWDFASALSGGMAYAFNDGRIQNFKIGGGLSTPLEKVIEKYGTPSHVFFARCDMSRCDTRLVYSTSGMAIAIYIEGEINDDGKWVITITPNDEVRIIEFFIPGQDGYLNAYEGFHEMFQIRSSPWIGYGSYVEGSN